MRICCFRRTQHEKGKPGCSVAVCLAWLLSETEALKGSRQSPSVWSSLLDAEYKPSRVAWNPNGRPYFCLGAPSWSGLAVCPKSEPHIWASNIWIMPAVPQGSAGFLRESFLLLHLNRNTRLLPVFFPPWTDSHSSDFLRPTKEEGKWPECLVKERFLPCVFHRLPR